MKSPFTYVGGFLLVIVALIIIAKLTGSESAPKLEEPQIEDFLPQETSREIEGKETGPVFVTGSLKLGIEEDSQ